MERAEFEKKYKEILKNERTLWELASPEQAEWMLAESAKKHAALYELHNRVENAKMEYGSLKGSVAVLQYQMGRLRWIVGVVGAWAAILTLALAAA